MKIHFITEEERRILDKISNLIFDNLSSFMSEKRAEKITRKADAIIEKSLEEGE
jgi:hypothetical protein